MPLLDIIKKGSTDRSVTIRIADATDGTPETAVEHNTAGIDLWYRREGAAKTSITEVALASLTTAHTDGGIEHISDGDYRLDIPDAAFASGANYVDIGGTVTGMIVFGGRVRLVDIDMEDATRAGLTALPNANAEAAGGLITRGTGAGQVNQDANGRLDVNLVAMGGGTQSATDLKDFADAGYDPVTNKVQGVVLVDTTTTNTDMRGTDSALLASSAPSNWSSFNIDGSGRVSLQLNDIDSTKIADSSYTFAKFSADFFSSGVGPAPWAVDATTEQDAGTFGRAVGDPGASGVSIYDLIGVPDATLADDIAALPKVLASGTCQSGSTSSTIVFAASESFADDILNGCRVNITSGTGAGQSRFISDYTGASDTATVKPDWVTTPDNTSLYEVVGDSAVGSLEDINLHLLLANALPTNWSTDITANSAIDYIADDGTATYDRTTESLQALRDRGDSAWTTGGGGSISDILNVTPLIPPVIDLAGTATVRIGLSLINSLDDLPTTAEITPGTISIDRKAMGGTSWSAIVTDAACSESAGLIYYDEVFDSGTGYAEGDIIRVTLKSQKITVSANDYEITDSTGIIFYSHIQQNVATKLTDLGLDHLLSTSVAGADVADDSVVAQLVSSSATADWDDFDNTTDSLQAQRDAGISDLINVVPLVPYSIDLANTATVRLGFSITNAIDNLPTTAEITPGTISIDRKAIGGTSWTSVVSDAACSESAGQIYYDEVFDSGTGYAEGDSIRVTFKSQKVVVNSVDYEITDSTGIMFQSEIRQTMRGTDSANTTTPLDAAGIRTAVGLASANLDTQLSTIDSNVDAILVDTGTTIPAQITGLNDLDAAGIRSAVGLASANLDTQLSTIDSNVDAILVDTGTTIPAQITALNDVSVSDIWTTALTEAYAADGAEGTGAQLLYMLWSGLSEFAISSTTITSKRLDGSTTAFTHTLDDATNPTSRTRAT